MKDHWKIEERVATGFHKGKSWYVHAERPNLYLAVHHLTMLIGKRRAMHLLRFYRLWTPNREHIRSGLVVPRLKRK